MRARHPGSHLRLHAAVPARDAVRHAERLRRHVQRSVSGRRILRAERRRVRVRLRPELPERRRVRSARWLRRNVPRQLPGGGRLRAQWRGVCLRVCSLVPGDGHVRRAGRLWRSLPDRELPRGRVLRGRCLHTGGVQPRVRVRSGLHRRRVRRALRADADALRLQSVLRRGRDLQPDHGDLQRDRVRAR